MRKKRHPKKIVPPKKVVRMNAMITAPEVRVLGDDGSFVGVMPTAQAIALAKEQGLDLLEVSPNAVPPVTRMMQMGKYQYEQEKKLKKAKAAQKKVDIKSIRLSLKISDHDKQIRVDQANKFFEDGHKVRIETLLRGREREHSQLAIQKMNQFIMDLQTSDKFHIISEQSPKMLGGQITALLVRKEKGE